MRFNKKAFSFFYLSAVFAIVLFFVFNMFFIGSQDNARFDKDFSFTKSIAVLVTREDSEDVFMDNFMKNYFTDSKVDFIETLTDKETMSSEKLDLENHVGCLFDGKYVIYNEKNIQNEISSCFPKTDDFEGEYLSFFENEITNELEEVFSNQKIDISSLDVSLNEGMMNVNIETTYSRESGKLDSKLSKSYNYGYNVDDYFLLISSLSKTLPLLSLGIKDNILSCKMDEDIDSNDKELLCIEKIFNNLIKENSPALLNYYDIKLNRYDMDDESFYGIELNILKKGDEKVDFSFLIIMENNIPLGLIDYTVKPHLTMDNVLTLDISNPSNIKPVYYVVLFSDENFLDKNSFSKYDYLFDLLSKGNIPKDFDQQFDIRNMKYYTPKEKDLNLDVIVTSTEVVDQDGSLSLDIYQKFDKDLGEYKLFESRPYYFAVFAVDSNFNYYTDESLLKSNLQMAQAVKKLGPRPVRSDEVAVTSKLSGMQNSVSVKLNGYDDESATSYQLYVLKGRGTGELKKDCAEVSYGCYYTYISKEDKTYLITSDYTNTAIDQEKYSILRADAFSSPFELKNGEEYEILVVPINSEGVGIFNDVSLEYEMKQMSNPNHFEMQNTGVGEILKVNFNKFTVFDDRAPDPMTSISIAGLSQNNDGNFLLSWIRNDPGVEKLALRGKVYIGDQGEYDQLNINDLSIENPIITVSDPARVTSIVIEKIVPIDSSGKPTIAEIDTITPTQTVSWP